MRIKCRMPGCPTYARGLRSQPFCTLHWAHVPEDLRERLQWANEEQNMTAYEAALHAAITDLGDLR